MIPARNISKEWPPTYERALILLKGKCASASILRHPDLNYRTYVQTLPEHAQSRECYLRMAYVYTSYQVVRGVK